MLMMEFIRKRLKFLMWFVSGAFVVGLFISGGTLGRSWLANVLPAWLLFLAPGCARSAGIIMKVNDYNIKLDEFRRIKENTIEVTRLRYKENFDMYARNMDFDSLTMESITKYAILLQEADRYNVHISSVELDQGIKEFPYQMPDEALSRVRPIPFYSYSIRPQSGEFSSDVFTYLLRTQGKITPEDFTKEVKNGLRIAKLKDTLEDSAFVTDLEIQEEYRKQNEKAKIKYVELQYKDFADKVQVNNAELNSFFQENLMNYKTEDKVSIQFIKIDPKQIEVNIKVSDAAVESYYKAHREQDYFKPEQVKARHILVRVDPSASVENKAKAKAYAQEILKEAQKPNADFATLAEKYSKRSSFEVKHEDLGFFERGSMVKPFEDAAFSLSPGEISKDLVETSYGYHIIKVEDKKAAQTKSLEEVRDEIISKLKEEDATMEARQKADEIQYTIMSEESLQAAVDANPDLNLKVEETGFFAKNEFIPKIGSAYTYRDVAEEAFKLKMGETSDLVEVKSYGDRVLGFFIFKLIAEKPGGIPKLEDVNSAVTTDFKNEKAKNLVIEEAKKIMAESVPADNLDNIAKKNNLKVNESDLFTLSESGYIQSQSSTIDSKAVMLKAFSMNVGEVAGPIEGRTGAYIIQLIEREKLDDKKIAQNLEQNKDQRKNLHSQIIRRKQQEIYDTWYQKVRSKASVKTFISISS